MANFDSAVSKTLTFEGGYTNNPNDPGGATKYGITLNVLKGFGKEYDLNHDGTINNEDVKLLSLDEAKEIYKEVYWRGENIVSQAIAEKHFDVGVNTGVVTATKMLQEACVNLGSNLVIDGDLGPKSLTNINSLNESKLMSAFCSLHEDYYWDITLNNIKSHSMSFSWPENLISIAITACSQHNLSEVKTVLITLDQLKLKKGLIAFIPGWIIRARNRFGV